jgi:hypothetical protein
MLSKKLITRDYLAHTLRHRVSPGAARLLGLNSRVERYYRVAKSLTIGLPSLQRQVSS